MGCVCSKEVVAVNGKKFKLVNKIADGYTVHKIQFYKNIFPYKLNALIADSELFIWLKSLKRTNCLR